MKSITTTNTPPATFEKSCNLGVRPASASTLRRAAYKLDNYGLVLIFGNRRYLHLSGIPGRTDLLLRGSVL